MKKKIAIPTAAITDTTNSALNQHDELLGRRHLDQPLKLRQEWLSVTGVARCLSVVDESASSEGVIDHASKDFKPLGVASPTGGESNCGDHLVVVASCCNNLS
jgi:hypothetical protein